ncbi:hypothetical protein N7463_001546 [Penicillium fimorum]|uniref:Uncharacterized protein n=1 Tax=Penicillium fimorum TaxID=1882269 RepID=A0A9W9Y983_9EURO|nr:hypothetical protein N7463_001546 [Penicillium fimorum]
MKDHVFGIEHKLIELVELTEFGGVASEKSPTKTQRGDDVTNQVLGTCFTSIGEEDKEVLETSQINEADPARRFHR